MTSSTYWSSPPSVSSLTSSSGPSSSSSPSSIDSGIDREEEEEEQTRRFGDELNVFDLGQKLGEEAPASERQEERGQRGLDPARVQRKRKRKPQSNIWGKGKVAKQAAEVKRRKCAQQRTGLRGGRQNGLQKDQEEDEAERGLLHSDLVYASAGTGLVASGESSGDVDGFNRFNGCDFNEAVLEALDHSIIIAREGDLVHFGNVLPISPRLDVVVQTEGCIPTPLLLESSTKMAGDGTVTPPVQIPSHPSTPWRAELPEDLVSDDDADVVNLALQASVYERFETTQPPAFIPFVNIVTAKEIIEKEDGGCFVGEDVRVAMGKTYWEIDLNKSAGSTTAESDCGEDDDDDVEEVEIMSGDDSQSCDEKEGDDDSNGADRQERVETAGQAINESQKEGRGGKVIPAGERMVGCENVCVHPTAKIVAANIIEAAASIKSAEEGCNDNFKSVQTDCNQQPYLPPRLPPNQDILPPSVTFDDKRISSDLAKKSIFDIELQGAQVAPRNMAILEQTGENSSYNRSNKSSQSDIRAVVGSAVVEATVLTTTKLPVPPAALSTTPDVSAPAPAVTVSSIVTTSPTSPGGGICRKAILVKTRVELSACGTILLRYEAAAHKVRNASKKLKDKVVEELWQHYVQCHAKDLKSKEPLEGPHSLVPEVVRMEEDIFDESESALVGIEESIKEKEGPQSLVPEVVRMEEDIFEESESALVGIEQSIKEKEVSQEGGNQVYLNEAMPIVSMTEVQGQIEEALLPDDSNESEEACGSEGGVLPEPINEATTHVNVKKGGEDYSNVQFDKSDLVDGQNKAPKRVVLTEADAVHDTGEPEIALPVGSKVAAKGASREGGKEDCIAVVDHDYVNTPPQSPLINNSIVNDEEEVIVYSDTQSDSGAGIGEEVSEPKHALITRGKKSRRANAWSMQKKNLLTEEAELEKRNAKLNEQKPFENPELERCRQNALNAKLNCERKKREKEGIAMEMTKLRTENQRLKKQESMPAADINDHCSSGHQDTHLPEGQSQIEEALLPDDSNESKETRGSEAGVLSEPINEANTHCNMEKGGEDYNNVEFDKSDFVEIFGSKVAVKSASQKGGKEDCPTVSLPSMPASDINDHCSSGHQDTHLPQGQCETIPGSKEESAGEANGNVIPATSALTQVCAKSVSPNHFLSDVARENELLRRQNENLQSQIEMMKSAMEKLIETQQGALNTFLLNCSK
jgi:hypothetical protein